MNSQTEVYSAATMNNVLVSMKDELLSEINTSSNEEALTECVKKLLFVAPLWETLNYGYKVRELKNRIKDAAQSQLEDEEEFLANERKNSKVRGVTLATIQQLRSIINVCNL